MPRSRRRQLTIEEQYDDYLRRYNKAQEVNAKRGHDMMDKKMSFTKYKIEREELIAERKELVAEGKIKNIGNVNQYMVSEQQFATSRQTAKAAQKWAKEEGLDVKIDRYTDIRDFTENSDVRDALRTRYKELKALYPEYSTQDLGRIISVEVYGSL